MFKKNIEFKDYRPMNSWRKIAVSTWNKPRDPSIYGWFDVDAKPLIRLLQEYREKGEKVSVTTVVARGVALAIAAYPKINGIIRFGKIYQRKQVNMFLLVAGEKDREDLSGIVVQDCDQKSLAEIQQEIREKSAEVKSGKDPEFRQTKNLLHRSPSWLVRIFLAIIDLVNYKLNLWTPLFGNPRDSFGSGMVTSVGMLGLQRGLAPLVPYSNCPIIVTVGKLEKKAMVEGDKVVVGDVLPVGATVDHRFIDGVGASQMFKAFKNYMQAPH